MAGEIILRKSPGAAADLIDDWRARGVRIASTGEVLAAVAPGASGASLGGTG